MSCQRGGSHVAFAQSQEENWTVIADAQKRKRIQNRLAQRSYRQKVRERLQELDQLKTADQSGGGSLGGSSTGASTRCTNPLDCNAAAKGRKSSTASTGSTVPPLAWSESSESSEFVSALGDSPFPWSGTLDQGKKQAPSIDDFLASLCSNDCTDASAMIQETSVVCTSHPSTTPRSETAEYGFDVFGPLTPSVAPTQKAELKFTELMIKIRDVGFVDMESMILEYYSTQFQRESLPYWLQRRSRQQNLCKLLEQLYMHSCSWPTEEGALFQTGFKEFAQRILNTDNSSNEGLLTFPFTIDDGSV